MTYERTYHADIRDWEHWTVRDHKQVMWRSYWNYLCKSNRNKVLYDGKIYQFKAENFSSTHVIVSKKLDVI